MQGAGDGDNDGGTHGDSGTGTSTTIGTGTGTGADTAREALRLLVQLHRDDAVPASEHGSRP